MEINESVIEEVATSESEAPEEAEEVTEPEPTEPIEEVAKPQQSAEENSKFAEIRRKYESENKKMKAEFDRLLDSLKGYGYEGSPQEIADALYAQNNGVSQEEAKAIREKEESALREKEELQSEIEMYKSLAIQKLMADDLSAIQSVHPEVKDLNELGEEFFSTLKALGEGRDPVLAYEIIKAKKDATTKKAPPEIGGVNQSSQKEKDFYTPAEVDKLTDKDYDNPKIMEAVRRSMSKWK
jgi:hypothetical protein